MPLSFISSTDIQNKYNNNKNNNQKILLILVWSMSGRSYLAENEQKKTTETKENLYFFAMILKDVKLNCRSLKIDKMKI